MPNRPLPGALQQHLPIPRQIIPQGPGQFIPQALGQFIPQAPRHFIPQAPDTSSRSLPDTSSHPHSQPTTPQRPPRYDDSVPDAPLLRLLPRPRTTSTGPGRRG